MLGWLFIPVYISAGVSSEILTFLLLFSPNLSPTGFIREDDRFTLGGGGGYSD